MIKNGIIEDAFINGVPVIQHLIPESNTTSRPNYPLEPKYIIVHNTGNSMADAMDNSKYIDVTESYVSWHLTVGDKMILQEMELNLSTWNAGDGKEGDGNRKGIAIEVSEGYSEDYSKCEENAIAVIIYLMEEFNLSIDAVKPHQFFNGKYCPHIILDNGWDNFIERIESKMEENKKSWQQKMGEKAVDELHKKKLIDSPDYCKGKDLENESTPLWLFFEMFNRNS